MKEMYIPSDANLKRIYRFVRRLFEAVRISYNDFDDLNFHSNGKFTHNQPGVEAAYNFHI